MKYGNYKFEARGVNNLGDQMQIIAMDHIYRMMGIQKDDIVYIDYHELKTYEGEYVILPVFMPMVDYYQDGFADRFSDHILPVFLGVTMVKETLTDREQAYLRKFEPIGCRDEKALRTMRKYGISSYLNGCITVTLPKRIGNYGKDVFIVDVEEDFLKFMPDKIRKNAKYRTHLRTDLLESPKEAALTQYDEYLQGASLVITSLLHCAIPCAAAGIPVILINSKVSYRKAWIEKILPIYTLEDADKIDWNPRPLDMEDHKRTVLNLTIKRLKEAYEKYAYIYDVSYFYESRVKHKYINDACESLVAFIEQNWKDHSFDYHYSIWGLTQIGEWIVDFISEEYPNAVLTHVYDSFREEQFKGILSESPNLIKDREFETILVTTNGAEKAAHQLFDEIGLPLSQQGFYTVIK